MFPRHLTSVTEEYRNGIYSLKWNIIALPKDAQKHSVIIKLTSSFNNK